jgi:pimeloyl-ACP methyl ester carboxylesterase
VVFSFDYRGEGKSQGVAHRVILEEQVRDIRNGVTFAAADPRTEPCDLFLVGWAMAAGTVLSAARDLEEIRAIVLLNGFFSGRRFLERAHGLERFRNLVGQISADRLARSHGAGSTFMPPYAMYPLDRVSGTYMAGIRSESVEYVGEQYSLEFAESLLRWVPEAEAHLLRLPAFVGHSLNNELHPPSESSRLIERYGGPVEFLEISHVGHTEWVEYGNAVLTDLCTRISKWADRLLLRLPVPSYPAPRRSEREP